MKKKYVGNSNPTEVAHSKRDATVAVELRRRLDDTYAGP